jgi:hypothetical protein
MTTTDIFRFTVHILGMILNGVLVFAFIFFFVKGLVTDDRKQFRKMMIAVGLLILANLLQWLILF